MESNVWKKCSSCKKDILLGKTYQVCEVSNCKKHIFCSVNCWNLHNEVMNHKSAGAIEQRAPFEHTIDSVKAETPRRILVDPTKNASSNTTSMDQEILIVASKLKQYIKEKHDLNTSANVMDILSNIVRKISDKASENAVSQGRKTLMDRDFE
jgi:histone H3/H4